MQSDQVQMYPIVQPEQSDNKENVVLRALVGNPNRHKPQAQHPPPTTLVSQGDIPASMYTLETRYRPIPPKVLPTPAQTKLYYINGNKSERPLSPTTNEEKDARLAAESNSGNMVVEEAYAPASFFEPKIFSQPVLYSIVGQKNVPVHNEKPITPPKDVPSPLFYSITGQPRRVPTDMSASTLNVETPVTNVSPTFYSLIGSPRLHVQFQEPIKQTSQISQPSQTSLPSLYSVVGGPHLQPQMQQPITKQVGPASQQNLPSPSFYSIVGGPALIPHFPETEIINPPPASERIKVSSVEPVPILYTIVGEIQAPKNIEKENRPPPAPVEKSVNDVSLYTVVGNPTIPPTVTHPRKTQPLQPIQQQEPKQQHIQNSALYSVVGKPTSPPKEKLETQLKPIVRRRTPPSTIYPTRRISRSLERRRPPEPEAENDNFLPKIKRNRQAKSREPTIPKSETTFIPILEHERSPRGRPPRAPPRRLSPGQIQHNPYNIPKYDPLRLPDYISPYSYHPTRPYREQTYNPISLPPLANNRYNSKPRPPFSEPRPRPDRKYPDNSSIHHSLERYPANTKRTPRLWDFEDGTQSDIDDDDDDMDEQKQNRKNQGYRRIRPRTPWIPVW